MGARTSLSAISPKGDEKVSIKCDIEYNRSVFHRWRDIADTDVRAPTCSDSLNRTFRINDKLS